MILSIFKNLLTVTYPRYFFLFCDLKPSLIPVFSNVIYFLVAMLLLFKDFLLTPALTLNHQTDLVLSLLRRSFIYFSVWFANLNLMLMHCYYYYVYVLEKNISR